MKILFLHRDLPPDTFTGVAIQVHRLANALADLGHEVSVYTHSSLPADARYRVLPIDLPGLRAALRFAPFLKRLWYPLWYRTLDMNGYDAVHIHGDGGFIRYRGNFVRTFYGTAALEYRHATGLKGKVAQGLVLLDGKARSPPLPLDRGHFTPRGRPPARGGSRYPLHAAGSAGLRRRMAKSPYPTLIYLGSLRSRKRGEAALDLFRKLKATHPDLRLNYVGPAREIADLKARDGHAGVDFRTRLTQDELAGLYRRKLDLPLPFQL